VANHGAVVRSVTQVDKVVNAVSPLFLDQGAEQTRSSAVAPPLVWTDEARFVAQAGTHAGGTLRDRVLMYPSPAAAAEYSLVSFSPAGGEVGRLLRTDSALRRLAVEHGMRTTDQPGVLPAFARQNGVAMPVNPNVIELPSYETGQALVARVEAAVLAAFGPSPSTPETTESVPSPVPSTGP
jgi:hypothetical protein